MEIEIEIIPKKEQEEVNIPFESIPAGTVYVALAGTTILKLDQNEAVLLNYNVNTRDFAKSLVLAKEFKKYPANRILGRIKKIVVEEV